MKSFSIIFSEKKKEKKDFSSILLGGSMEEQHCLLKKEKISLGRKKLKYACICIGCLVFKKKNLFYFLNLLKLFSSFIFRRRILKKKRFGGIWERFRGKKKKRTRTNHNKKNNNRLEEGKT